MKYADRIMSLMACAPGAEFRMAEIVRYIDPRTTDRAKKEAIRKQARVVLSVLADSGSVKIIPAQASGAQAIYIWQKREFNCLKSGSKSGRIALETLRPA